MAKKKVEIKNETLEPQEVLLKPYKLEQYNNFRNKCVSNNWKIVDLADRFIAILQTQEYKDGEIVDITDELLEEAKENKLKEADTKASNFCQEASILITSNENLFKASNDVEFASFNISSLNISMLVGYYITLNDDETLKWKDDNENIITLNKTQIKEIIKILQANQTSVWIEQNTEIKQNINNCSTLEEVEDIKIKYNTLLRDKK